MVRGASIDFRHSKEDVMSKLKNIPEFTSADEEREFWAKEDSIECIEWKKAKRVSSPFQSSSLLPPPSLCGFRNPLKTIANKRDVPYQSLIKIFLKERIDEEFKQSV